MAVSLSDISRASPCQITPKPHRDPALLSSTSSAHVAHGSRLPTSSLEEEVRHNTYCAPCRRGDISEHTKPIKHGVTFVVKHLFLYLHSAAWNDADVKQNLAREAVQPVLCVSPASLR